VCCFVRVTTTRTLRSPRWRVTDVIVLSFLLFDVTVCRDAAEINLVKAAALGRGGRD